MNITSTAANFLAKCLALATFGCLGLAALQAQPASPQAPWIWINSSGIKTFSDVAPPAGTPDKNILSRPGQFASTAPGAASGAASGAQASNATAPVSRVAASAASVPRISGRDSELEKRMKAEEAAKKAAEEAADKAAIAKAEAAVKEACDRATRLATGLASGGRIATTNARGEREFMSDEQRQESLRKAQNTVSECNK